MTRCLFVIDNGRDYSDHAIYFVAAEPGLDTEAVRRILALFPRLRLIGRVAPLDWSGPQTSIADLLLDESDMDLVTEDRAESEGLDVHALIEAVPEPWREQLYRRFEVHWDWERRP